MQTISTSRQLRVTVLPLLAFLLAACSSTPPAPGVVAWQCDGQLQFDAITAEGSARLRILGETYELERELASEGRRYASDGMSFEPGDKEAQLLLQGERYHCRIDKMLQLARSSGIAFRATGQEPGWILDIIPGSRFILQYDYGVQRVEIPHVPPQRLDDGTLIHFLDTQSGSFKLVLEPRECRDSMSGMRHAWSVKLAWQELDLRGCGREL